MYNEIKSSIKVENTVSRYGSHVKDELNKVNICLHFFILCIHANNLENLNLSYIMGRDLGG